MWGVVVVGDRNGDVRPVGVGDRLVDGGFRNGFLVDILEIRKEYFSVDDDGGGWV
jgi:hypothetical protein